MNERGPVAAIEALGLLAREVEAIEKWPISLG
jgi:hypothetical protein